MENSGTVCEGIMTLIPAWTCACGSCCCTEVMERAVWRREAIEIQSSIHVLTSWNNPNDGSDLSV